jgi:3-oxoadipate enol-lactonase
VGVSNGGSVALQFAVRWPARVRALVLANAYGRADTIMQVKLNSWLAGMAAGGGPLRFDISCPWIWGATFLNGHFDALKPFREQGSALPIHAVQHLIAGGMQHDVLEAAANIACPTLLMTGDEDLLTPLSYSQQLQRRIAGSRLVMLEQAGHCMFQEQPARFAQIAADFCYETLLKG